MLPMLGFSLAAPRVSYEFGNHNLYLTLEDSSSCRLYSDQQSSTTVLTITWSGAFSPRSLAAAH